MVWILQVHCSTVLASKCEGTLFLSLVLPWLTINIINSTPRTLTSRLCRRPHCCPPVAVLEYQMLAKQRLLDTPAVSMLGFEQLMPEYGLLIPLISVPKPCSC